MMLLSYKETISLWHEFIMGASIETLAEMFGGTEQEVKKWVNGVIKGEINCDYAGSWTGDRWNPRRDKILLRMKKHREQLRWRTACRLLAFSTTHVRQRLAFLEGRTAYDCNSYKFHALPQEEWDRFHVPQKPLGPVKKHRIPGINAPLE